MTDEPGQPTRNLMLPATFLGAVRQGRVEHVEQMLRDGFSNINYVEAKTGLTALHYAAARNAVAIVRILMATGRCDVTLRDRRGRSAAALAVEVADNPVLGRYLYDQQSRQETDAEPVGAARRRRSRPRRGI